VKIAVRIGCLLLGFLLCSAALAACNSGSSGHSTATATPSSAFQTTSKTSDNALVIRLSVSPSHLGENQFTVTVTDAGSGQAVTQAKVTLFNTMTTMYMGTDDLLMQSNGKGQYTASALFTMSGKWQVHVAVRTADNALHETTMFFTVAA
jgi:hypothetical protein